jgi:threonine aldolase
MNQTHSDVSLDFRSDTVTQPTPAMREAMAAAVVGDDVYGEDPTVNRLQEEAARRTGKEAGLFVTSGSMGNLVAILCHAGRGDEAIAGQDAHTLLWEAGGMATLGGIFPHPLPTDADGRMDPVQVEAAVRADNPHLAHSRLLLLENSYGSRGGFPLPPGYFAGMRTIAERHELRIHLDGARLFNAAIALGCAPADLTADVDSVTFCLSKGLAAPVGSVLCGSRDFIHQARRQRKLLGGGMRQAGILAAAGLVALDQMVDRLAEDHANARHMAEGLDAIDAVSVDIPRVQTNIVFFTLGPESPVDANGLAAALRKRHGIQVGADGPRLLRAVTHNGIDAGQVERFVHAVEDVMRDNRPRAT